MPSAGRGMMRPAIALDEIRHDLMDLSSRLEGLVEGPARMLAQQSRQTLAGLVFRIGVIGQVKAGKSSFVNALVGRPGLLPADVNPWTTAVTRLNFGGTAPQGVAAAFRFFDRDEWAAIAAGRGRLRELTERLVPGFAPAALSEQLAAMKARAAERLGPEFGRLLGTSHTFPKIDGDVLERYVCAGSSRQLQSGQGRYSDITRTADLYFESNGFGFPAVVIDTPGTNDPFLVRDEITRRTLDDADFHIAVLTAQQPLSTADVALLRILRGLHKDRIVVFVNRIDQLAALPGDAEMIAGLVRSGLAAEFPGIDVPIVVGSALWANASLSIATHDRAPLVTDGLRAWARHVTGRDPGERGTQTPAELAGVLMAASGIPQLREVLGEALLDSHASRQVAHASASLCELARVGEMSMDTEVAGLLAGPAASAHISAYEAENLQEVSDRVQHLEAEFAHTVADIDRQSNALVQRQCDALAGRLEDQIERFIGEECQRLGRAMSQDRPLSSWRVDAAVLRQRIETEYLTRFSETANLIAGPGHGILHRLQQSVADVLPDAFHGLEVALARAPVIPPSLSVLGRAVVFDLAHPWWLAWWTGRVSPDDRVRELARLIRQEFAPLGTDLVTAARTRLMQQAAATVQNAKVIAASVVGALRAQSERRAASVQELRAAGRSGDVAAAAARRRNLDEAHEERRQWQAISMALGDVHDRCRRLLAAVPHGRKGQPGSRGVIGAREVNL